MTETLLVVGSVLLSAACFLGMASLFKELSRIERLISDTMVRHEDNLHEIDGIVSKHVSVSLNNRYQNGEKK